MKKVAPNTRICQKVAKPACAAKPYPSRVSRNISQLFLESEFSWMDSLPNFLTHGAPQERFARESSAIKRVSSVARESNVPLSWGKSTGNFPIHLLLFAD